MRCRVGILAGVLCAVAAEVGAVGYTVHSITASELHEHQAYPLRALLLDARERSHTQFQAWLGDPGGEGDIPGLGLSARWHRSTASGLGYGAVAGVHGSTIGGWLIGAEISHALYELENASVGVTAIAGYQKMDDGYGLSCQDAFGGWSTIDVDGLDYLTFGAALHGEQRFGWLRLSLDAILTQMRPSLREGDSSFTSGADCPGDHEEVQTDFVIGSGLAVGGENLELYGGIAPAMVVLRFSAAF